MNYAEIIQQGESKTVEFKEILPEGEKIAKSVIAFANTGGGRIFIGVRDDGTIAGVDDATLIDLKDKVANIIYDSIAPNLFPNIYSVRYDDKSLLVIDVAISNGRPHYLRSAGTRKGAYIRLGATNRIADEQMLQNMLRLRQNISYDEEICYAEPADESKCNKLKQLLDQHIERKNKFTDIDLRNLRLIKEENGKDYLTYGAAILLGLPHNARINCARFSGVDQIEFLDRKDCEGDLFTQLEQAEKFLMFNLNLGSKIEGLKRIDEYEIPRAAFREALINAAAHRDYSVMGCDVKVAVNRDSVEIISPGDFPGGAKEEDVLKGRSDIRNKVIARILKESDYIEQWGTGIIRMRSACRAVGLPEPEIKERGYFVSVKFARPDLERANSGRIPDEYRTITGRLPDDKTQHNISVRDESARMVLEYLDASGSITRGQVESLLNVGKSRAAEVLSRLVDENAIEQVGGGRSAKYVAKR